MHISEDSRFAFTFNFLRPSIPLCSIICALLYFRSVFPVSYSSPLTVLYERKFYLPPRARIRLRREYFTLTARRCECMLLQQMYIYAESVTISGEATPPGIHGHALECESLYGVVPYRIYFLVRIPFCRVCPRPKVQYCSRLRGDSRFLQLS